MHRAAQNRILSLQINYIIKIRVVGDSGVGKSAMINRFVENTYNPTYITTIGVDYKIKSFKLLF